jgi:uncharacterized protein (DUF2126 family)
VHTPYTDKQWQEILAAGAAVEAALTAGDVRLSMGGEPTFVASTDPAALEWNTAALGPTKRDYADKLARRLRDRFAKGGVLHYGLGKWYPGEAEPRWAYSIYWRRDGVPLWQNPGLIAEEPQRTATIEHAETFSAELCRSLGLPSDSAIPAYEDAAHYMLIEQKLPVGITPDRNTLFPAHEREMLMRTFDRGLATPTGYVLPLIARTDAAGRRTFGTERWAFRRQHLFLLPGSLPIGLRLPLSGLPEITYVDYPHVLPADPFADHRKPSSDAETTSPPAAADDPVRTALAVELRNGHICIFLPPLSDGADYAHLLSAIETTAARTGQAVRIEGYEPPTDARIHVIKVTPDPGVLEINTHPAASWDEAVAITTTVYDEAVHVELAAEKKRFDGLRVGTGGGSHIVVGGLTPADSPFLRRPDLLASVITYWQNHPSLSYLFAGQFLGPTSQAPRVDEARHESLYELEIALAQIPVAGNTVPPWLVDRLFRNLLVDATGNTHRAEICIDKLYAPEGPMGRLGLVEFRAFEMAPHAHMSLAQQLPVRALIARFWMAPYRQPLVRWGTILHDRFMLPHFLWADFCSVIAELRDAGLSLDADWFRPHLDFRLPVAGTVTCAGVHLEVRQALEPWLVLGEQAGGGTSRPVDSSLERLQVRVTGADGDRIALVCNGYRVPLTPTEEAGVSVAAIRFRTWRNSGGLHPNIEPHVPLTFDIVDTRVGMSLGGCRYHTHPARTFEPLSAGSRTAPLQDTGVHPDFPLTLDLRRTIPG